MKKGVVVSYDKVKIGDFTFTREEVQEMLTKMKEEKPPKWVALNTTGEVLGWGDTVVYKSYNVVGGIEAEVTGHNNTVVESWFYYGDDEYTIVTLKQYEALYKAGLAEKEERLAAFFKEKS